MKDFLLEDLKKEQLELLAKINNIEKNIELESNTYLEIKKNKGKYRQYYECQILDEKDSNGENRVTRKYISKEKIVIAKNLAQKEYDKRLLDDLRQRYEVLGPVINYYENHPKDSLFNSLSQERKALVQSEYVDDETYINMWMSKYSNSDADKDLFYKKHPITKPYYTEKGEQVRSKSEKIIADKLFKEGIPYVYEPSIMIGGVILHPDFVILNIQERKTYIYEHFGMMDNPEYSTKCVNKILMYEENGLVYGRNFLYTFETQQDGLDTLQLDRIINRYCL